MLLYYQHPRGWFLRTIHIELAEWRSGSVSALPCERPGFASRTRLREIIPANNCTMQGQNNCTGARLDARTYTFAHPIWRTTNAARKQGAISPILPAFCKYYLCDAIMLIKLSMVWPWITGITTLEVAIVVVNFARDARMNTVNVCRMRERIEQDARTSLLMRERTHIYIVHLGSFY